MQTNILDLKFLFYLFNKNHTFFLYKDFYVETIFGTRSNNHPAHSIMNEIFFFVFDFFFGKFWVFLWFEILVHKKYEFGM